MLHNNRAHTNLKLEAHDAALEDSTFISNPENRSEKALYRGSQALYNQGRFDECARVLAVLTKKFPGCATFTKELSRLQQRLGEQRNGTYDFERMYAATKARPPKVDCATFTGPISVDVSPGRGRGYFTNREVKAGELLLCEKAFAHCYAPSTKELSKQSYADASVLVDIPSNKVSFGADADLIRNIAVKLQRNPSLIPSFKDLHHGSYKAVSETIVDGSPVVDT